jgi:hypothetical protein
MSTNPGAGNLNAGLALQTYLALTDGGALLVVAISNGDTETHLREGLRRRGHRKFIAWPVPADEVCRAYGVVFQVIAAGLSPEQPLRVVDFEGARVFDNLSLAGLDAPLLVEGLARKTVGRERTVLRMPGRTPRRTARRSDHR